GEASGMGHLAPGDERKTGRCRETEEVLEPAAGDLLDDGGGGSGGVQAGVLVPGGGQPIRGERRRDRAAHDPPEEAAAGRAYQGALDVADQLGNHLLRGEAGVPERLAEARAN